MRTAHIALLALAAVAVIAAGCGGGGGEPADPGSTSYLPLAMGNTWEYELTIAPDVVPAQDGENQHFPYRETVTGTATLQGTSYWVIETVREAAEGYSEQTWQQFRRVDEEAVYARVSLLDPDTGLPTLTYDLPFLKLPPTAGQTWSDPQIEDDTYETVSVNEQVTVAAGTFNCVRVDREYEYRPDEEADPTAIVVRSWYARGVGLVRDETREGQTLTSTLELQSYDLN